MAGSTAKRSQMADEQVWCHEQRLKGLSLRTISEMSEAALGKRLSIETVHRRVEKELVQRPQASAAPLRALELDKLDEQEVLVRGVQSRVHFKTSGGEIVRDPETGEPLIDDAPVLAANTSLLRIQERRAKLLGLEAPQQIVTDATVRYEVVDIDTGKLA